MRQNLIEQPINAVLITSWDFHKKLVSQKLSLTTSKNSQNTSKYTKTYGLRNQGDWALPSFSFATLHGFVSMTIDGQVGELASLQDHVLNWHKKKYSE